ncbi:ArfGap-domain-containing protein [Flagelloscypha sp. PMI_526]|nr:ArfGap-domain-containing protein [Flagelloscypha sp. PMI_526]
MDQAESRKILHALIKQDGLDNKVCVDCSNPNPQWASLSFAVFLCLQCAGTHRGFGVHISFVRSVSMDTWQKDQITRMELGGNKPFKDFMKSYDPATGGFSETLSSYDTYHCWAATQYRESLDAKLAGKEWSPSAPSVTDAPPSRPTSAQGLRKSRTSARSNTGSSLRNDSSSPAPASLSNSPSIGGPSDQKAANESYFARLGAANADRPDTLPPSQGGRYTGFGSTPSPSQHPAYGTSSASVPTLSELQENPMGALTKGWSLFSSAVSTAASTVNTSVIQPGMAKVQDPTFQASVRGYMSEAQKQAANAGSAVNNFGKNQFGVDVGEQLSGLTGSGRPDRSGYGALAMDNDEQSSALYSDENYFDSYDNPATVSPLQETHPTKPGASNTTKKGDGWEDEDWKDF